MVLVYKISECFLEPNLVSVAMNFLFISAVQLPLKCNLKEFLGEKKSSVEYHLESFVFPTGFI